MKKLIGILFGIILLLGNVYAWSYIQPSENFDINTTSGLVVFRPLNTTWLNFNGNSSNITIPDHPEYSINKTGGLTVSLWINVSNWNFTGQSATSHYINYFQKKGGSASKCEWEFRMYNSSGIDGNARPCRFSFYIFNESCGLGAGADYQNNATIDICDSSWIGSWINVIGGLDVTTNSSFIYVNGKRSQPSANTLLSTYGLKLNDSTANITIGRDLDSTSPWLNASMDDIRIYNYTLDNGQIKQLYNSRTNNYPITKNNYNQTWLNFTATKDYVRTSYNVSNNHTTYMGWFYKYNNLTQDILMGTDSPTGMIIRIEPAQSIRFFPNTTSASTFALSALNNVWTHWAITYNNTDGNATLYINGAINGSALIATARYNQDVGYLLIGKRGIAPVSDMFDGMQDEIRVYTGLLTLAQIQSINNSGRKENLTVLSTNLQVYYPMTEGEYSGYIYDKSGNNLHGVIYDAQWIDDGILINSSLLGNLPGLIAHFRLNENNGTVAYDVIKGNNGTIKNTSWVNDAINITNSPFSTALYLTDLVNARLMYATGQIISYNVYGAYTLNFYNNLSIMVTDNVLAARDNANTICSNMGTGFEDLFNVVPLIFLLLGIFLPIGATLLIIAAAGGYDFEGYLDFKVVAGFIGGIGVLAIMAIGGLAVLSIMCSFI